uniref:LDB2 n=1 Tax=Pavo cristatus TaxID=9049 RepID=A0A8C9FQF1_PAVCR
MSSAPHDPFYSSPFGPFYRRHTPYMVQPEYRIYEMNKRLQARSEDSDNLWWDAFATEFFEDDATLTLSFCLEDGPKRYRNFAAIDSTFAGRASGFKQGPEKLPTYVSVVV